MLIDLTAVDYPKRDRRFELVYEIYSFSRNERLRVKANLADGEPAQSLTGVHAGPTGWNAKCSICSASGSKVIPG